MRVRGGRFLIIFPLNICFEPKIKNFVFYFSGLGSSTSMFVYDQIITIYGQDKILNDKKFRVEFEIEN